MLMLWSPTLPYSQAWNPVDKVNDARYASFGLAPKGKADYAFLLHDHVSSEAKRHYGHCFTAWGAVSRRGRGKHS